MFSNSSLIDLPWVILGAIWLAAAAGKKPVLHRQPTRNRFITMLLMLLGFALLAGPWFEVGWLGRRFTSATSALFLAGLAVTWAGIAFAVWARLMLGRNWSGRPSLMADHELITSGPYALVRHPIYTGLLIAGAGTALSVGEWHSVFGFLLVTAVFVLKIRAEERIMIKAFPDAYPHYRSRVKALIPGVL